MQLYITLEPSAFQLGQFYDFSEDSVQMDFLMPINNLAGIGDNNGDNIINGTIMVGLCSKNDGNTFWLGKCCFDWIYIKGQNLLIKPNAPFLIILI